VHVLMMNPYIQYCVFNIWIVVLYSLSLSDSYNVNGYFISYVITTIIFFLLISIKYLFCHRRITRQYVEKRILCIDNKKLWNRLLFSTFIIGTISQIYQVSTFGATIFQENMVNRISGEHYVNYFVNLLQVSLMLSYISIKLKVNSNIKLMKFIFLCSLVLLSLQMNRGAFTPFLFVYIYINYLISYVNNSVDKWMRKLLIVGIVFVLFFGFFGDLRVKYVMEEVYHTTVNQHYGMSDYWPTSFVWIYMYLTSPLENAGRIFMEQEVWVYHYGFNMLYPFLAPLSKGLFVNHGNFYSPLEADMGLNVYTFIPDAITDFGIVGPYIYMIYLFVLYFIGFSLFKNIYGLLCYVNIVHLGAWMFFVNAFAIAVDLIMYILFGVMAFIVLRKTNISTKT